MAAESSSNHHSSSALSGDGNNNPQLQRTAWAQVVRGDHEAMPAASSSSSSPSASPPPPPPPVAAAEQSTFSDCSASKEAQLVSSDGNDSNVAHPKKPAWNKPLNGVAGVGPVIGGDVSWPALSESTRPPTKSTSDSPKPDSSVSAAQGPVITQTPQNQQHANANANSNPNLTANNTMPARQRSSKRGGGSGSGVGSIQGGYRRPPMPPPLPPPFPLFEMPYGPLVAPVPDSSLREPPYKGNNWDGRPVGGFISQPHPVNNQHSQPNSSRRGNTGGRHRGDDLHHSSHGGRRDQDRYWNSSRSSSSRDIHMAQQIARPRGFLRGPPPPPLPLPGSTPYMGPQYVRPFGTPMGFDMTSPLFYVPTLPPESFRGLPFIANGPPPPPPMFYPVMDVPLPNKLVEQIDYYFSDGNLVKDDFLRSKMDDEGWVPIELIAKFPRVQQLTDNIQLILDSLRASSIVEVQRDKVRRRSEWKKWMRTSGWFRMESGLQSPVGLTETTLATALQKVTLDEATSDQSDILENTNSKAEVVLSRSSSEPNEEHINEEACSGRM